MWAKVTKAVSAYRMACLLIEVKTESSAAPVRGANSQLKPSHRVLDIWLTIKRH